MPKVAIYEYGNPLLLENDVWTARKRSDVFLESQATHQKLALEDFLDGTIFQLHASHRA